MTTPRNAVMIFCGLALWSGSLTLAQDTQKKKDAIFIGRLTVKSSLVDAAEQDRQLKTDLTRALDVIESQMPVALARIGIFDLVERERLQELNEEGKLAALKAGTDPNPLLKKTGATYAFLPEVDTFVFGDDRGGAHIDGVGRRNDIRLKMLVRATVRIVEVAHGKVLPDQISVQWPKRGDADYGVLDGEKVDFDVARQQMLVDMSEQLARVAIIQAVGNVRPAKVLVINEAKAEDRQAVLNRGDSAGLTKGSRINFYDTQTVKDPDTDEPITNEFYVGRGVVERAETRKCFVQILEEVKGRHVAEGIIAKLDNDSGAMSAAGSLPVTSPSPSALVRGDLAPAASAMTGLTPAPAPEAVDWVSRLARADSVKFAPEKLKKKVRVNAVRPTLLSTRFLKVSTELAAQDEITVTGTYRWFDESGAPVTPQETRPKTIFLRAKMPATIDGIAPDTRVRSFELVIEAQGS